MINQLSRCSCFWISYLRVYLKWIFLILKVRNSNYLITSLRGQNSEGKFQAHFQSALIVIRAFKTINRQLRTNFVWIREPWRKIGSGRKRWYNRKWRFKAWKERWKGRTFRNWLAWIIITWSWTCRRKPSSRARSRLNKIKEIRKRKGKAIIDCSWRQKKRRRRRTISQGRRGIEFSSNWS